MIAAGDTVWAAISGGADSVCLFHILKSLSQEIGFTLRAVHINHLLRGNESDSDEKFCNELCIKNGIDISVFRTDVKKISSDKGMTLEQAGRSVRYDIFEKNCPGKVALAHNMNDSAETILMNLMRGSGAAGLCGIKPITGKYIRPLIETTRTDIESFCTDNNILYRTDSSNSDTVFFRNAVRHKVLPLLNEISGKDVIPMLDRTAKAISEDDDFINESAEKAYDEYVKMDEGRSIIDNPGILNLHPAVISRVTRKSIEAVKGNLTDIESRHISLLFDIIRENRTGSAVSFPDGVNALVQFGKTIIYKDAEKINFEYKLPVPGKIFIKEKNLDITAELCENHGKTDPKGDILYFSEECAKEGFFVRNRRNGDIIKPSKGRGTLKLKKYFIDRKIERHIRNQLILIVCGDSVAYIEGMEYGKEFLPVAGKPAVKVVLRRR